MDFTGTDPFLLFPPASQGLVFHSHFRKWASGNEGKAGKKDFSRLCSFLPPSLGSCLPSLASPPSITLLTVGLGSSKQESQAISYRCGRTDTTCGLKRLFRGLAIVSPMCKRYFKSRNTAVCFEL